jgi:hypothetical protein
LGFQAISQHESSGIGVVSGHIYAKLHADDTSGVSLPDVSIFVRNLDNGIVTAGSKTTVDGEYQLTNLSPGRYQLCWQAPGWVSDCLTNSISLPDDDELEAQYPEEIGIAPLIGPSAAGTRNGVITGVVQLGSGGSCEYSNTLFGIQQSSFITATDSAGHVVRGPVRANDDGEYVLAGVPAAEIRVRATCGPASTEAMVEALQFSSDTIVALDLNINSLPPESVSMNAKLYGELVTTVLPGSAVQLTAEAKGGNPDSLQYRWTTDQGFGSIRSSEGNQAQWIAPPDFSSGKIHVLVADGKGGFTDSSITLQVEGTSAKDPTPEPYAHAVVKNGMRQGEDGQYIPPYPDYTPDPPYMSPFLTLKGNTGDGTTTAKYYQTVIGPGYTDPTHCTEKERCTLGTWLTANGWNADGTVKTGGKEARTVFLNNNDLGYVRDMHCTHLDTDESKVACWVTNYSSPNQEVVDIYKNKMLLLNIKKLENDFTNASQATPNGKGGAQATVTMEYRIIPNVNHNKPVVTFIAYGPPPPGKKLGDAPVTEGSSQDGFDERPIPGMCNNCHGGRDFNINVRDGDPINVHGQFIVFDLSTFIYSKQDGLKKSDQQAAFKNQNLWVKLTDPEPAIKNLICGWYSKGFQGTRGCKDSDLTLPEAYEQYVPVGWKGQETLYGNVVRTCRTCHTALINGRNFTSYDNFQTNAKKISKQVCGAGNNVTKVMPHDAISYLNFWRDEPPGNPLAGYPFTPVRMTHPYLTMGTFLAAQVPPVDVGNCKAGKGKP